MQIFNRKAGEQQDAAGANAAEQPAPISQAELVLAAVVRAKPVALVKIEAKVSQLRESRSTISSKLTTLIPMRDDHISRTGRLPAEVAELERQIQSLDQEIRTAREEMRRRRQEFVEGEFARVAREFKAQAAAEIRQCMPMLTRGLDVLAALDHAAMRNGVEFRSGSAEVGTILRVLNSIGA